ncbi:Uncharacterized protein dnm_046360 [Desulfonema magnum]|uniref:Secreted protein n=1 Tax=Desulfonema magnum TaxID=45655 RepID=A0A975GP88_9BACT|nr:Uncharacterized protein dnm_046360 [Desulfonema magnum]
MFRARTIVFILLNLFVFVLSKSTQQPEAFSGQKECKNRTKWFFAQSGKNFLAADTAGSGQTAESDRVTSLVRQSF